MSIGVAQSVEQPATASPSPAKAWLRALEMTAPIVARPSRTLAVVIDEIADEFGAAPALLSEAEDLSFRALAERSCRYARWALDHAVAKDDTVCLMMPNRPEYVAAWLGITRIGGVVALINTNLSGPGLAHCIDIVAPRRVIVAAELLEAFTGALPALAGAPTIWIHGADHDAYARLDRALDRCSGAPLAEAEQRPVTIADRALCIYTSGTTGLPKAANVSHHRLMQTLMCRRDIAAAFNHEMAWPTARPAWTYVEYRDEPLTTAPTMEDSLDWDSALTLICRLAMARDTVLRPLHNEDQAAGEAGPAAAEVVDPPAQPARPARAAVTPPAATAKAVVGVDMPAPPPGAPRRVITTGPGPIARHEGENAPLRCRATATPIVALWAGMALAILGAVAALAALLS